MSRVVMLTKDEQIDRRILLEADSLQAAGWQVTIVAMPREESARGADDARVVRLQRRTGSALSHERLVLNVYHRVRRHVAIGSPAMRALRAFAWRHVVSQEKLFINLFADTVALHPADVYLAHDLPLLPVALHAAQRTSAKVVYDSHELFTEQEFAESEKRMWIAIEARHIGRCDAVMTVNRSIARELALRYGLEHVHVVYNAERVSMPAVRRRRFHEAFGLSDSTRVLLLQGGLSAGRQIEVLVGAMQHIRTSDLQLVVLGDGQLKPALRQLVESRRLGGRVLLQDAVPQAELASWTVSADAGVIPYQATCLNNYYCTPNKLFEFIAAGLPVLGSDMPELRTIIEGHELGQVADLSDERRIACAIDAFFEDDARMARWRSAASRAREVLNWDIEGGKVVDLFEGLR